MRYEVRRVILKKYHPPASAYHPEFCYRFKSSIELFGMEALNDTEIAVLELLVAKPMTSFSPLAASAAARLSQLGFAVCQDGQWFVTARGVELTHRYVH